MKQFNRSDFIEKYNISDQYSDFFGSDLVLKIEKFISGRSFSPNIEDVFKALRNPISEIKVVIIGQDPYPQEGVATGLSFEVGGYNSWEKPLLQRSLQNIVRVLYSSYYNDFLKFSEIREKIRKGLKILPPNKIFKSWNSQGVMLLNRSLTVEVGKPDSHTLFWKDITDSLIEYISRKNRDIIYFLWGKNAQELEAKIYGGKIFKSNHPSRLNSKNSEDFTFFEGFRETKNFIDWI
ncbi:MAG: uracil-DNA glycosylase [Candidatus Cloacimonadota bacterium]|nr:MAG: uracil-DNA glycosylase [Candidatus Cloacimonadota bacterium]PIE77907.1 MAG: uracil-DNA glycosylase [Candidatus Delongbacteria bacterium]